MPVITLDGPKLSKQQKADLVREMVAKASEITGIPAKAFVTLIRENEPDNIGNGENLLSDLHR